jgi:hypothetical protein
MKRVHWIVALLLAASPAWADKKVTLAQLKDLLISLQQANKADADVAAEIEHVELTEEMSRSAMNSLKPYSPGPLTAEQLFILEARSSVLPPPAAELPTVPAPDAATQKTILDRAQEYVTKTYAQLPNLTATEAMRRFQDNAEPIPPAKSSHSLAVVATPFTPIRYMTGTETPVTLHNGAAQNPLANDKTHWGDNGKIALIGPDPVLTSVLTEAQATGKIGWLRWQTIGGHQIAVFSFSVDKKKTHYAVNYCCFPDVDDAGDQDLNIRGTGGPGGNSQGNYKLNANWKPYKATVPYHGEIFIDPDTGIVARLVTHADFKSSELVREEDRRIDFGPETVGSATLVAPVESFIITVALPYGDTQEGRANPRNTLFTAEYKNYQAAGN